MNIKIKGTITRISPTEHRGNFKKREFHLITEEKKEYGIVTFYNDCYLLNDLNIKDIVQVDIEIQCKNWTGRKITNLVAKKINLLDDRGTKEQHAIKKKLLEHRRRGNQPIKVDLQSGKK
jgi:hypothetical protein